MHIKIATYCIHKVYHKAKMSWTRRCKSGEKNNLFKGKISDHLRGYGVERKLMVRNWKKCASDSRLLMESQGLEMLTEGKMV